MRNPCALSACVRAAVLASVISVLTVAAPPRALAAPVTWLEDDRLLVAEASVEWVFDDDAASPPSPFAAWSEDVLAQPDEFAPFSGAGAGQQSAFKSQQVTATGGAGLLNGEPPFGDGSAESRVRATFELKASMPFEFEGTLSAFSDGATSWTSVTLWHEPSETFLIDELVEDDEIAFSLSGDMPAGTYEYELLAYVDTLPLSSPGPASGHAAHDDSFNDEMPFTAGAQFDSTSLVITPAPGAFGAGAALLGAMLLRRGRSGRPRVSAHAASPSGQHGSDA